MLSNLTYRTLRFHMMVADYLGCLPYELNKKTGQYVTKAGIFGRLFRGFTNVFELVYIINLAISLCNGLSHPNDNTRKTAMDLMFTMGYGVCYSFNLNCWIYGEDMAGFMNMCLAWNNRMAKKYRVKPKKKDGCEVLLGVNPSSLIFFAPVALIIFCLNTENTRYLYHRIPDTWKSIPVVICYTLLVELTAPIRLITMFGANYNIVIVSTKCFDFWLKKLGGVSGENVSDTDSENCSSEWYSYLRDYDSIRILSSISNKAFSTIVWPAFFVTSSTMGAIGIFGTVRLYEDVPLETFILFPGLVLVCITCQFVLFPMQGSIVLNSAKFIENVQTFAPNKSERLRWKALRTVGARVGPVFQIKKTTVATSLMMTVSLAANAMLLTS